MLDCSHVPTDSKTLCVPLFCWRRQNKISNSYQAFCFAQIRLFLSFSLKQQIMDFNLNGAVERNDAYLLARANMGMVRFIRSLHVNFPDHRNKATDCVLEITAKLSTRDGKMETDSSTKVYFEFASREKVLSLQLMGTSFDNGELITTYDNLNELFGGIVKAESRDETFHVVAKKSQIEIANMGLSMIQVTQDALRQAAVVTPLFKFSRVPMFSTTLQVQLSPNSELVLRSGHSPQLTVNITESYATCQDPPVTKNVMFVFENDYTEVEGNEDSFAKSIIADLTARFPLVKIGNMRFARGSILVYFDITTQKSRMDKTLVALWDMLKSGYTLQVNSIEYQALKVMRVDGKDYQGNDALSTAGDDKSGFPTAVVIAVCVVIIVVVIAAAACFFFRKRIKSRKDRFSWKNSSKNNIIDSRSTSRMSSEAVDTEMVLIGGFYNDSFDYSDSEASISPRSSSRNSLAQIDNFSKRKLRKVQSSSSQVSVEAWSESGSPTLGRRISTPQVPVSSLALHTRLKGASLVGKLLTKKQKSDSQLLTQVNSSTEGSPLDLSPQTPKRGESLQKRLPAQNSLCNVNSDSSDEDFAKRGSLSSTTDALTPSSKKSLTPQISGSRLLDQGPEHFVLEKAVLHKRQKPQKSRKLFKSLKLKPSAK